VTQASWYEYAIDHRALVPHLLIDRSPCQDPFFDPYAANEATRRPLISGLCRCLKWFDTDDLLIYVTRLSSTVAKVMGLPESSGPRYLGVAALRVQDTWNSHAEAAADFRARRYVASPEITPYPPNLAFAPSPQAAAARGSSIVYSHDDHCSRTPLKSTEKQWESQYRTYHRRQQLRRLRVASCAVAAVEGSRCLQLQPQLAPILEPSAWGGLVMSLGGRLIDDRTADQLCERIASGR
jgi:hypothetical protein